MISSGCECVGRRGGEVVLKSRNPWKEITPEREWSKDSAPLKVKEAQVGAQARGLDFILTTFVKTNAK